MQQLHTLNSSEVNPVVLLDSDVHPALLLLLKQPRILQDHKVICKLLCSSNAMAACIAATCTGRVTVRYLARTLQQAQQLGTWLARNGLLVKQLLRPAAYNDKDVRALANSGGDPRLEAAIAAGLAAAAAEAAAAAASSALVEAAEAAVAPAPAVLPLQCYQHVTAHPSDGAVLTALTTHLTSLELCLHRKDVDCVVAAFGPLARFKGLRSLTLDINVFCVSPPSQALLASLSQLSQLTRLQLELEINTCALAIVQHVPAQLQELKVTIAYSSSYGGTAPLQLGHLSALTQLELPGLQLQEGDILPPQLQVLRVGSCAVAQELLALQQLRVLGMDESYTPADQLLQLSSLRQLSEVELRYCRSPYLDVALTAAAAWSSLPVKKLDVAQWDIISTTVVQQLGMLSGLTHLGLGVNEYMSHFEATPQQLAAQLAPLTALRQLELFCLEFQPAAAGGMRALLRAVAGLPQLVYLNLKYMAGGDAVAELAAATKLTHLGIIRSELDDANLAVLATSLVRLQSLSLMDNTSITGASLTALAAASQLTYLALEGCSVNDTNLALLAKSPLQLHSLDLRDMAAITDASVAVLAAHQQQLTCLEVDFESVTKAALQQICNSLRKLVKLNGTAV